LAEVLGTPLIVKYRHEMTKDRAAQVCEDSERRNAYTERGAPLRRWTPNASVRSLVAILKRPFRGFESVDIRGALFGSLPLRLAWQVKHI
jgi:hypothetical protein